MKKIKLLLCLVVVAACTGPSLRPDSSPAAEKVNYPTAEFRACGETFVGLGFCAVPDGTPVDSIGLAVEGYMKGRIRVQGERMGYDESFTYEKTGSYEIDLPSHPVRDVFVINITNALEYPVERDVTEVRSGLRGHLVVFPDKGEQWSREYSKVPRKLLGVLAIDTAGIELIKIRSVFGDREFRVERPGEPFLLQTEALGMDEAESGLFWVSAVGPGVKRFYAWAVWKYIERFEEKDFVPLPIPIVKVGKKELTVTADHSVLAISVNHDYKVGNELKFKVDVSRCNDVRMITLGGRFMYGKVCPGEETSWLR